MPESGGPTTQSGIRYQNTVTAVFLGQMLAEAVSGRAAGDHIARVRSEAASAVDDTVVTYASGRQRFIQAKEDVAKGSDAWRKLWRDFQMQVSSSAFVRGRDTVELWVGGSRSEFQDLGEAAERTAGYADDPMAWWAALSQNQRQVVDSLASILGFTKGPSSEVLSFMSCLKVVAYSADQLEREAIRKLPSSSLPEEALLRLLRDRVGGNARYRISFEPDDLLRTLELERVRFGGPSSLDDAWFRSLIDRAKKHCYPRYTPELRIGTPTADALEALGQTDTWHAQVAKRARTFQVLAESWPRRVATREAGPWEASFPEPLRGAGEALTPLLEAVSKRLQGWAGKGDQVSPELLVRDLDAALEKALEIRTSLAADLDVVHGQGSAESKSFRQFQAEVMVSFPAANLDAADELIVALRDLEAWARSALPRLALCRSACLLGEAGSGKTHALCDAAESRAARGMRTIPLFGEWFSDSLL
jgi:hypothetical protein